VKGKGTEKGEGREKKSKGKEEREGRG